jgi:hypothetical protein
MHRRTWTDSRDGTEWRITYNPGVELARPEERARRSRLIFEGGGERHHTDAVYGGGLETLTDEDLQGLLDQARAREEAENETAWGSEEDAPDG